MNRPEWTPVVSDENIMNLERAVSGFGIETNYFVFLLSKVREIIKEYKDEMHDYGGTRRAAVNKFIDELGVFLNKAGNQLTEIPFVPRIKDIICCGKGATVEAAWESWLKNLKEILSEEGTFKYWRMKGTVEQPKIDFDTDIVTFTVYSRIIISDIAFKGIEEIKIGE